MELVTRTEAVDIIKQIHLLILNGPPDLTLPQQGYIYMGEDDGKNDAKYSLNIQMNKKNGHIEFKPAPVSPTFTGKCVRLS